MSRRQELDHRWRANSLWLVPMLCIVIGGVAVSATLSIDGAAGYDLLPSTVFGINVVTSVMSRIARRSRNRSRAIA